MCARTSDVGVADRQAHAHTSRGTGRQDDDDVVGNNEMMSVGNLKPGGGVKNAKQNKNVKNRRSLVSRRAVGAIGTSLFITPHRGTFRYIVAGTVL